MAACDAAISLGGRPLRAVGSTFFFMELSLTERGVKSVDIGVAFTIKRNVKENKVKGIGRITD
jgi:hypothetical protein